MTVATPEPAASLRPRAPHTTAPAAAAAPGTGEQALPERALRFRAGAESFAIDILSIREIRSYEAPTRLPGAGEELQGVIDLRGIVIPVIDLRRRLGCQQARAVPAVTVVTELAGALVGLAVDTVEDVQDVLPERVRAVPPLRTVSHVTAMLAVEGELVQLLDLGRLLENAPRHASPQR